MERREFLTTTAPSAAGLATSAVTSSEAADGPREVLVGDTWPGWRGPTGLSLARTCLHSMNDKMTAPPVPGPLRASVTSTDASAGTCGAPTPAASSLTAQPFDAGLFWPRRLAIPQRMLGAAIALMSLYACHPRPVNAYRFASGSGVNSHQCEEGDAISDELRKCDFP
jgi:hypothetical protein